MSYLAVTFKLIIMKKIIFTLSFIAILAFQGCTGPEGPRGANGQDGLLSIVYETPYISFTSTGSFSYLYTFPAVIYDSDHVLVYRLVSSINNVDLWDPLPKTYYQANGTRDFSFEFNFTKTDVEIYLDGNNLQTITDPYRLNQIFRIVVVPGKFGKQVKNLDNLDYNTLIKTLNVDESQVKK